MKINNSVVIFGAVSAVVLGFWTYTQAITNNISVCVRKGGTVHVVGSDFKREDCKKNETLLTWSTQGEKGDKGDQGPRGDKGEQGIPGINAQTLPNTLTPSVTDFRLCKSGSEFRLYWKLSNSYGVLPSNSATAYGTLTNGVWSKNRNGILDNIENISFISFLLTSEELSTTATGTPVSFSGGVIWQGFVVPLAGSAISSDFPVCHNL